jgi:hypothetical protein
VNGASRRDDDRGERERANDNGFWSGLLELPGKSDKKNGTSECLSKNPKRCTQNDK